MEAVKGAERGVHPSDKLASFAPHQLTLAKCRFGSKADIPPCGTMSALPPIADIRADEIDVRFVPLATKVHRSKNGVPFDHFVKRCCTGCAECLSLFILASR